MFPVFLYYEIRKETTSENKKFKNHFQNVLLQNLCKSTNANKYICKILQYMKTNKII